MPARSSQSDPNQMTLWFAVSLIVITLLFIPAVVLMALYIIGHSTGLNGWLQDHFHPSIGPNVPWWAGLVAFLLPPLIILLYFLKLKRLPLQVPTACLLKNSY